MAKGGGMSARAIALRVASSPASRAANRSSVFSARGLLAYAVLFSSFSRIFAFASQLLTGQPLLGQWLCLGIWLLLFSTFLARHAGTPLVRRIVRGMVLVSAFFGAMWLFHPVTRPFFSASLSTLCFVVAVGVPSAMLLAHEVDLNDFVLSLLPYLRVVCILSLLTLGAGIRMVFLTSMGWGQTVTEPALFYYAYCRICPKLTGRPPLFMDRVMATVLFALALLGGRQWFIMCILTVGFGYLWSADTGKKKFAIWTAGIFSLLCVALFYNDLLELLSHFLNAFGIQSRALEHLVSGQLLDATNRAGIYQFDREIIARNGMKVSGMFADRYFLKMYSSDIAHAHNFFYEMLIDFGTLWGGIVSIATVFLLVRGFLKGGRRFQLVFVVFFCFGFLRYMVSSSVFANINFTLFCGLLFHRSFRRSVFRSFPPPPSWEPHGGHQ